MGISHQSKGRKRKIVGDRLREAEKEEEEQGSQPGV
jgi:hypothetical protein